MLKVLTLICILLLAKIKADSVEDFLLYSKVVAMKESQENACMDNESQFVRSNRGCAWYFLCDEDRQVIREDRCPTGHRFDEENQNCNLKDLVECYLDEQWANAKCSEESGISLIPHPYTCSKFTVCFDGDEIYRDCPPGQHFSMFENDCVDPFLADCEIDYNLCKESVESGVPAIVGDSKDCGAFYVCAGATAVPLRCSPGQGFNSISAWCELNDCEELDDPLPDQIFMDCTNIEALEVPHPSACAFYFICVDNRSYLRSCGDGLIFDIDTFRCQIEDSDPRPICITDVPPAETVKVKYPKMLKIILVIVLITFTSADVVEKNLAKQRKYVQGLRDERCLELDEVHFSRNTRGCAWYFRCDEEGNVESEDRCPGNLWFNEEDQMCSNPEDVECDLDDRWVDVVCPNEVGISVIPHPYTCSKYTVCFDGLQNDRDCPQGLHFSTYEKKCVDPFLADCKLDQSLCEGSGNGNIPFFIASSRDCRAYYICIGDSLLPLMCAPGQHFLPEAGWCDLQEKSDCKQLIPENTPQIPDKDSIDCQESNGLALPHPDSCEFYFFCAGDLSFMRACGDELIFDINSRRCQNRDNPGVSCILDPPTEEPPTGGPVPAAVN
ncbi:CLUMA_CG020982, isoform A [Clunio marinus]|uniref:CLUMA_CG020982, isoform A n=1 Tax=Clunio marinus TaxID=568069 RepID=A0A1J1J910_9DIPT|nr:CLUMA_CG020982, isoform A [Clunio marinus]